MTAEVIKLIEGPTLHDISGQLRGLADRIDAGEYGEVPTLIVVMPREGAYPKLLVWGSIDGLNEPIVQLEMAKLFAINTITGDE